MNNYANLNKLFNNSGKLDKHLNTRDSEPDMVNNGANIHQQIHLSHC